MPRKAIGPEAMTPAERAARSREDRKAYVAALEAAVLDAAEYAVLTKFRVDHAATIARARGTAAAEPTPAPVPPPKAAPKPSPKSTPRPNAPQTLAQKTVQPRFRGSSKR
jgi:hypothetical protein